MLVKTILEPFKGHDMDEQLNLHSIESSDNRYSLFRKLPNKRHSQTWYQKFTSRKEDLDIKDEVI